MFGSITEIKEQLCHYSDKNTRATDANDEAEDDEADANNPKISIRLFMVPLNILGFLVEVQFHNFQT